MISSSPGRWPHEWLQECRHPVFIFPLQDQFYGFYLFSLPTWMELLTLIVLHALMGAGTAVLIYYSVIRNKSRSSNNILPFLSTFGVFLPFWIFAPKAVLEYWQMKNHLFLFSLCVITPTTSIFRLLEGYFDFAPAHAQRSLGNFCLYFGSPLLLKFNTKTQTYIPTNGTVIWGHLSRFLLLLFTTGMYQSLFVCLQYHNTSASSSSFWPTFGIPAFDDYYDLKHVFNPKVWMRTALYAILLQQYLTTFGEGLMLATNVLTGKQTEMLMDNPMFASTSPSDFWGRRWNLLIHHCLKGGVYKPIRSLGGNQACAVFGAFWASGLFHEWIVPCVFYNYQPQIVGGQLVFFAWQAMLVALEAVLGGTQPVVWMQKNLPRSVRSFLVILCGLPFGHWFLDAYVNAKFFENGHMIFFAILPLQPSSQ